MLAALGLAPEAHAAEDYEFGLDGFYRVRGHAFNQLYADSPNGRYMTHKLRLAPYINFEDRASFYMSADALTDVVWGDNESKASTALFAGNPSDTGVDGLPVTNFEVKRAWLDFKVPVGVIKVGRQPSNWGMGLLANDGDGFDDTFGENKYGATYDRFIFATKPIAIAQTIAGKTVSDIPFFTAFGIDRLVEEPLTEYYGYTCDPDDPDDSIYCAADDDHGYTEDRETTQREDDWWASHGDDVVEFIYVAIYKGEDLTWGGRAADFTLGSYVVNRRQWESWSNIWIIDAYSKLNYHNIAFETEVLTIQGDTEAIALPGAYDPTAATEDGHGALKKTADIWGGVVRLGYEKPLYTVMMEAGRASGDDDLIDGDFTVRAIHPDHNVGLLLYEEILARATAYTLGDPLAGLWSKGGVYNSKYIFPNVRWRPMDNWEVIAAYLVAWPDKPDGAVILTDDDANDAWLGKEIDLAVKHRWHEHLNFSYEMGWVTVSDRIAYENLGLTQDGKAWTIQSRLAYEF